MKVLIRVLMWFLIPAIGAFVMPSYAQKNDIILMAIVIVHITNLLPMQLWQLSRGREKRDGVSDRITIKLRP
jgi:hypothetical protein